MVHDAHAEVKDVRDARTAEFIAGMIAHLRLDHPTIVSTDVAERGMALIVADTLGSPHIDLAGVPVSWLAGRPGNQGKGEPSQDDRGGLDEAPPIAACDPARFTLAADVIAGRPTIVVVGEISEAEPLLGPLAWLASGRPSPLVIVGVRAQLGALHKLAAVVDDAVWSETIGHGAPPEPYGMSRAGVARTGMRQT